MGNQEVEEREGKQEDEAEVNPDASEPAEEPKGGGFRGGGVDFQRRRRRERVLVKRIGQSGAPEERTGRRKRRVRARIKIRVCLSHQRPLVRSGFGSRRRRRGRNCVILRKRRIDQNLRRRAGSGSRRQEKRRRRVEIGRDATAFFSDLNFRFLLMHYITITTEKSPISHTLSL